MANINAPKGFVPIRHLNGSPWNGQVTPAFLPTSDGTAVFVGDVVKYAGSSGTVGVTVNGKDMEGVPTVNVITASTTGQDIFGVVVGFLPDPDALSTKYRPASKARVALVVTDPTVIYEVQEDADTTPIAAASIGLNTAIITTAGSTTTGVSQMQLDSSAVATTSTLPVKVLGLVKRPDNHFNTGGSGTDPAKFEVMFNTGAFMPNTSGVA